MTSSLTQSSPRLRGGRGFPISIRAFTPSALGEIATCYSRFSVSSKFKSTLATTVQAAAWVSSSGFSRRRRGRPWLWRLSRRGEAVELLAVQRQKSIQLARFRRPGQHEPEAAVAWAAGSAASRSMRRARAWAASTYTGSLSTVRACSGVLVRGRRATQNSRLGASKLVNSGYGVVRFQNV